MITRVVKVARIMPILSPMIALTTTMRGITRSSQFILPFLIRRQGDHRDLQL